MQLSIVSTMYRSEGYLEEFHARMVAAAERTASTFELILVDDGCPTGSLAVALDLAAADRRVKVVELSRNFGHHEAMLEGLAHARGERVFLIDCDLEEDPALLLEFAQVLDEHPGADVAYGVQARREDRIDRRIAASLYYTAFNSLSAHPIPRNLLTVRLMTRRYVDALLSFPETQTQIAGLWALAGFEQVPVDVAKGAKGTSTYTLRRRLAHLVNAVTSFSARPLVLLFYGGLTITVLAATIAAYFVYRKVAHGVDTEGFTALIVAVSFFGGLTVAGQGLIGMYVAKIFIETKRRPRTIVRAVHGDP